METVIFIESNTSGTGEIFIKKTLEYNYKPIFLTINARLYSFLYKFPQIDIYTINTMDMYEILDFCNNHISRGNIIKGVISTSEYYAQMAAKIANVFNLPGANEIAIENCRNKYIQYKILKNNGFQVPKTNIINQIDEINKQIVDVDFPVIIKPIAGSGSVGVRLCNNYAEYYDYVKTQLSVKENERGIKIDNRVLVEDYISGQEYSAEVFNGVLIGITQKYLSKLPYFVEIGHDYPAMLSDEEYKTTEKVVLNAIKVLNLEWGSCHVEFKLVNNQVFFIEVNPRLAGGYIPEIVKMSTGIDLIDNQIRASLALSTELKKCRNSHIGIRFIIPENEGVINNYKNVQNYNGVLEIKQYKPTGTIYKKHYDFRDRIGHIIFDMDLISPTKIESIIKNLKGD